MNQRRPLSSAELQASLTDMAGWQEIDGNLAKSYKFSSFAAAIGWMVSVAIYADKIDHHPEWSNVYNRVQVNLVTHDLDNAISTWDLDLAKKMDDLASY